MRTITLFLASVFLLFSLWGKDEEIEVFGGEWIENGGIRKLHDTPLGGVYEFPLSEVWTCLPDSWPGGPSRRITHPANCRCSRCEIRRNGIKSSLSISFGKKKLKNKRFVVLDFRVRAFPALTNSKTPEYQFQVVRSEATKIDSDYGNISGMVRIRSGRLYTFDTTAVRPANYWVMETDGTYYKPNFEPHSYRIIFDTRTGKRLTVIVNGYSQVYLQPEEPIPGDGPIEINSLGIISQSRGGDERYRRRILEFSPPKVYRFDSPKLLESLPELKVAPYPYDSYAIAGSRRGRALSAEEEARNLKHHKNPDLQYAYALRLLYGKDPHPARALELLEKAAREDHVLAIYQLGLCYWRGYGMEPDLRKADRYLRTADRYDYLQANVLRSAILWNENNRPKFNEGKSWNGDIAKTLRLSDWHNHAHDLYAFISIINGLGGYHLVEMSPKRYSLSHWNFLLRSVNKDQPDPKAETLRELDSQIRTGYRPACLLKALLLRSLDAPAEEIMAPLAKGAAEGDAECRVMLLEMKAATGKLDAKEFTPELEMELGDYPMYALLEFAVRNPDVPGVAEFLKFEKDFSRSKRIWSKPETPESHYLLGLLEWTVAFPYARMHASVESEPRKPKFTERNDLGASGFKHLAAAARGGVPGAVYLIARQYCLGDYPAEDAYSDRERAFQAGLTMMKKAAAAGHLKARFYLLEAETETANRKRLTEMLTENGEFEQLQYAPAALLKAKILEKLKTSGDAPAAYEQAGNRGMREAWRLLALEAAARKQEAKANAFWEKYIQADREFREQDRYDFFYPSYRIDLPRHAWMITGIHKCDTLEEYHALEAD